MVGTNGSNLWMFIPPKYHHSSWVYNMFIAGYSGIQWEIWIR